MHVERLRIPGMSMPNSAETMRFSILMLGLFEGKLHMHALSERRCQHCTKLGHDFPTTLSCMGLCQSKSEDMASCNVLTL